MALDIPTISLVITIVDLLYTLALIIQWRLAQVYAGLGWFALAMAATTLGFGMTYLRAIPSLALIGIFGNNVAFVLTSVFFYIGVVRFYGRRERREWLIAALAVFIVADFYLTFISNEIVTRRTVFNLTYAFFIGMAAWATAHYSQPSRSASALLLIFAFAFNSASLILSTIINVLSPADASPVVASLSQLNSFLGGLIGNTLETLGVILLVNQRLSSENRKNLENLELVFNTSPDAILLTRLNDGRILRVNDGFTVLTGYTRADVQNRSTLDIHLWKDPAERETLMKLLADKDTVENYEIALERKDGGVMVGLISGRVILVDGEAQMISITRDITERKLLQERIQQQAITDDLTGLFNRRHFMERAALELKRAQRLKRDLALAMIDLDWFKRINDTYGHVAGDQILVAFVQAIRVQVREIDLIARFGGDEFIVLFPETTDSQAAEVVERMRLSLASGAVDQSGTAVELSLSAGIAQLGEEAKTLDALIQRADKMLYRAKLLGRNRVEYI
jgi:diguanylate cyclase (GGDEF)-like protein/PAS domain S-box-containing protein